jgi:hypothetical protein
MQILTDLIKKYILTPKGIEVMAGLGWLSYWLIRNDIDIIATTDNKTWKGFNFNKTPVSIEKIDCVDAVKKYRHKTNLIIMSWPYMDMNAWRVARALGKHQWLLYIGEGPGGCTASDGFFRYIEKNFEIYRPERPFKRFYGIHDAPWLMRRIIKTIRDNK